MTAGDDEAFARGDGDHAGAKNLSGVGNGQGNLQIHGEGAIRATCIGLAVCAWDKDSFG